MYYYFCRYYNITKEDLLCSCFVVVIVIVVVIIIIIIIIINVDLHSVVGIVIRYGLDGLVIESQRGREFPQPSRPALRPTQPPTRVPVLFAGGKAVGAWR